MKACEFGTGIGGDGRWRNYGRSCISSVKCQLKAIQSASFGGGSSGGGGGGGVERTECRQCRRTRATTTTFNSAFC